VFNSFYNWAKINNVELDDLSTDMPESNRKGTLKKIVLKLTNVETGRPRDENDDRINVYYSLELSDLGEELLRK